MFRVLNFNGFKCKFVLGIGMWGVFGGDFDWLICGLFDFFECFKDDRCDLGGFFLEE